MTHRRRSTISSSPKQKANQNSMKTQMKRCRKQSEPEQVSRKKTKVDYFSLLHDDYVLEILQKLPADILRYKAEFVCKRWFNIITNKILLNHASLILQKTFRTHTTRLMDITEEEKGLKTKDQFLEIPFNGRIKSWCNEFLLITDTDKQGSLWIYNLVTKQGSFLPSCTTSCGGHYGCKCGVGLSYDGFKGVYKVVHVFWGPQIQCELLILKGDTITSTSSDSSRWKKINGPYYTGERKFYWDDPVLVKGRYFHWDVHCSKYLVSMDSVKERFRLTSLPGSDGSKRYSFAEMGGFLTLFQKVYLKKINIWMLKDYQRTKWEKVQSISISSSVYSSVNQSSVLPLPITILKSKRYIIFKKPGSETALYSYDLKDKVMKKLDINIAYSERCMVQSISTSFF